jgi:tyrosinase
VKCLAKLPAKTLKAAAPGVRSRYDDLIVAHIMNTPTIHWSGYFLPWHRQMVHLHEKLLRDECGYTGGQPYWDWAKYADKPFSENPMFDATETSFSGDGAPVLHNGSTTVVVPAGLYQDNDAILVFRPPGSGGGCIKSGPFVDLVANLGPIGVLGLPQKPNPRPDGLGYNPRCVIRDFAPTGTLAATNSYQNLTDLILNHTCMTHNSPLPDGCNANVGNFH